MKVPIYTQTKEKVGEKELPFQFHEPYRPDLIRRAVRALQLNSRQPYGASPEAGQRASAKLSRRRKNYRGSYGHGISRVPRKILSRNGMRMYWVGAIAPGTVGGRRAHPPKAEKSRDIKINDTERRKAIRSAIAATMQAEVVRQRGHRISNEYPFLIDTKAEGIDKTKNVEGLLEKLGFAEELTRAKEKKIRAGRGKSRGRPYTKKKSVLFVVSKQCPLQQAAQNIPGVDVVDVHALNTMLLAPGTYPGRATLWSAAAIDVLEKEKLFM